MIDFLNKIISYIVTICSVYWHFMENLIRAIMVLSSTVSSYFNIIPLLPTLIGTGITAYLAIMALKFILGR